MINIDFLQLTEMTQKVDELESVCHKLEEDKFAAENDLINSKDISQKLDNKKMEAESEIRRLTNTVDKVVNNQILYT